MGEKGTWEIILESKSWSSSSSIKDSPAISLFFFSSRSFSMALLRTSTSSLDSIPKNFCFYNLSTALSLCIHHLPWKDVCCLQFSFFFFFFFLIGHVTSFDCFLNNSRHLQPFLLLLSIREIWSRRVQSKFVLMWFGFVISILMNQNQSWIHTV